MTPDQFKAAGIRLYGRKGWRTKLARDLAVDQSTIFRVMKREQIAGPYEVALRGMLENKKQRDAIEAAARKLIPRRIRRKMAKPSKGKPHVKRAGKTNHGADGSGDRAGSAQPENNQPAENATMEDAADGTA